MNKQTFFIKHLAQWLFEVDWHYNTLVGISIECTNDFPSDGNELINELLLRYPVKPTQNSITNFLLESDRITNWFKFKINRPTIKRFSLKPKPSSLIEKPLPTIDSVGDLAEWLSLSVSELDWFTQCWREDAFSSEHFKHYRYDLLEKRSGGMRLIEKPKTKLKKVQHKIYHEILCTLNTHPAAHGFCIGRNCVSHASNHIGKRYLMSYDIADCFHSINWPLIKAVFLRLGYTTEVASYLTALCTHRVQLNYKTWRLFNSAQQSRLKQRHLPQGAPTSPALANAALHRLDFRLAGLAKKLDMDYSRYADDIALSSNTHRDWRFLEPLIGSICLDEGISLNYNKTRIKRSHQKQRLVGIVVNTKTNIDRQYFDSLKATLINCKRYGLDSQNRNGHAHFREHLYGRIQYVKSLNKQRGEKLERIYHEIDV